MYDRWRFLVIVLMLALLGISTVLAILRHEFPMSFGGVLCLIPPLLHELDRKNGMAPRKLSILEWSYVLSGMFWVFVSTFAD